MCIGIRSPNLDRITYSNRLLCRTKSLWFPLLAVVAVLVSSCAADTADTEPAAVDEPLIQRTSLPESTVSPSSVAAPTSASSATQATSASSITGSSIADSSTVSSTSVPSTTAPSTTVSSTTESEPTTDASPTGPTGTTTGALGATDPSLPDQVVSLRFESQVDDVPVAVFKETALTILNDARSWGQAGFSFRSDPSSDFRVVLAEGAAVDQLCLPLRTYSKVSCQNGPVVALNADRWRSAVPHWTLGVDVYRGYLVNHEVGHLIGLRHPAPRCPVPGRPAGVMEQQTSGLEGCVGNQWPRDWEIELARVRPVVYAPLPDWGPDPVPANAEN